MVGIAHMYGVLPLQPGTALLLPHTTETPNPYPAIPTNTYQTVQMHPVLLRARTLR